VAENLSREKRSKIMASIRSRSNKDTELALCLILRRHQITGWRRNYPLLGKPDFIFLKDRLAIFVDGCFWHFCPRHGKFPSTNSRYWKAKLERNKARDKHVTATLRRSGWTVLRIWEHSLTDSVSIANSIRRHLASVGQREPRERIQARAKGISFRKV